jgi:iron complex outermembrane receptor protein
MNKSQCRPTLLKLFVGATIAAGFNDPVLAVEPLDSAPLEEIVVTAQKRETRLQDTPIAISAFTSQAIEQQRIEHANDLGNLVPSMTFAQSNNQQQISIRGIGFDNAFVTSQEGVAFYIDGVYLGRPAVALATFDELDRIEVLRGPQGTLFGRNAIGGAVNLITKKPSDTVEVDASATYGNYNLAEVTGGISGPIAPDLSARLSGSFSRRDGYTENVLTGGSVDSVGGDSAFRGSVLYKPGDQFDLLLSGDFEKIRSGGPADKPYNVDSTVGPDVVQFDAAGGRYVNDPYKVYDLLPGRWVQQFSGASATATYRTDAVTFKSLTAFRDTRDSQQTDLNGTDGFFDTLYTLEPPEPWGQKAWQVSQEFQANGQLGTYFSWLAGVFYYHEHEWVNVINEELDYTTFNLETISYFLTQITDSYAAYGEGYYNITDKLKFTAGARYSSDQGHFTLTLPGGGVQSKVWDAFTPKAGLEFRPDDHDLIYATVSEGYKAGGFNGYSNQGPFSPERLWAYEVGSKSDFFDRHAQIDLAAFHYDYRNIQVTQYTQLGPDISNVGSGKADGVEADVVASPIRALRLNLSAAYLHTAYDQFELTDLLIGVPHNVGGNPFVKAPTASASAGAEYRVSVGPMDVVGRYDLAYKSGFNFSAFDLPATQQRAYRVSDASLSLEPRNGTWRLSLWGKNIFGEKVLSSAIEASSLLLPTVTYNPPATYGITISYRH